MKNPLSFIPDLSEVHKVLTEKHFEDDHLFIGMSLLTIRQHLVQLSKNLLSVEMTSTNKFHFFEFEERLWVMLTDKSMNSILHIVKKFERQAFHYRNCRFL